MMGKKASPLRSVCKNCRNRFRPHRSDAEFCSNQCRQEDYRTRKKDESINVARRKAEDVKPYADLFGDYRGYAAYLRDIAQRYDAKVRFIGMPEGILAVEETPEALATAPEYWGVGGALSMFREKRLHSTDREVVEVFLQPDLGESFIQREYQKECRDLTLKGARTVYVFTFDWEHYVANSPPSQSLPSWDYERDEPPEDDGLSSDQIVELLASKRYQVGKAT